MDPVTQAGEVLRGRASEARERLEDAVQTSRKKVETNVHMHPMRSVLMAAGAGMLIGLLLGLVRRRDTD